SVARHPACEHGALEPELTIDDAQYEPLSGVHAGIAQRGRPLGSGAASRVTCHPGLPGPLVPLAGTRGPDPAVPLREVADDVVGGVASDGAVAERRLADGGDATAVVGPVGGDLAVVERQPALGGDAAAVVRPVAGDLAVVERQRAAAVADAAAAGVGRVAGHLPLL